MSKARDNNSIRQKCEDAGISISTYFWRVNHGWSNPFAEASRSKITKEMAELLKSNGISRSLFSERKTHGWTELEASNVPPNNHIYKLNGKSVRSQIPLKKYHTFRRLVAEEGLSIEDAVYYALNGGEVNE
jgi:hypothetical protein